MCDDMEAHHNCGHVHRWVIRCWVAQGLNEAHCGQGLWFWQYREDFVCPACREERRREVRQLLGR